MSKYLDLKSRYFRRLYLTFMAFFAGVGLCIILFVYTTISSSVIERERESMKDQILLLEPGARRVLQDVHPDVEHLFSSTPHPPDKIRFTLFAASGEMVADSHSFPKAVEQLWDYPEVHEAMAEDWGEEIREVTIFQEKTLIVAYAIRSLQSQDPSQVLGLVRAELPFSAIHQLTEDVRRTMLWIALVCVILACVFGYFMARLRAVPLAQMAEVCRAIQLGDYTKKVTRIPSDEMGELARTLNDLSWNILSKISSLSLERAQLKSMLACMQEGIISLSAEGKILFCNLSAYHHLSLDPLSDLRSHNIQDISGLSQITEIWRHVLHHKRFKIKEIVLLPEKVEAQVQTDSAHKTDQNQDKENTEKYLQVYATFYESLPEGDVTQKHSGVMVVIDNHTEIKHLQNLRRDFFAHASHELKTPLTSIQGYVETLLQGAVEDAGVREKFLEKIHKNTLRMIALVRDLLSLSRIDGKSTSLFLRPLQWMPVVRKVLENHEQSMQKRKIVLQVDPQYGDLLVRAEAESMYTIFENLLMNAIRYSKEDGKIRIWFTKQRGYVSLHVSDTGVGIAPEHQERIFERFYRVDKARSRREGGTGLGLSIVKLLCEKLSGEVTVHSRVGQGSTLSVRLVRVF